ncbi:putative glutathione-dependent formaldehyde-activating [Phaeomoniella chlamydospora]|uniref:Putative glutathione-dependent formaldehyde-activating n=1 Tax=Phaeomoniella chlamydospora TaxID=158046 RepID=A0A0G2FPQ0_PHACM|nr:putative glutathione-dependent formaldehyde-activating [Phaeomoniella chlamydospora]
MATTETFVPLKGHCTLLCTDYGDDFTWTTFVDAGTLDDQSKQTVKPDVHINTSTKMDWVDLTSEKERGIQVLEKDYKASQVWRKDALERFDVLKQRRKKAKEEEEESKSTGGA